MDRSGELLAIIARLTEQIQRKDEQIMALLKENERLRVAIESSCHTEVGTDEPPAAASNSA